MTILRNICFNIKYIYCKKELFQKSKVFRMIKFEQKKVCRLLECYATWLLQEPTFRRNVSSLSSAFVVFFCRVGAPPSPEDWNRSSFRNVVFSGLWKSEQWTKSRSLVVIIVFVCSVLHCLRLLLQRTALALWNWNRTNTVPVVGFGVAWDSSTALPSGHQFYRAERVKRRDMVHSSHWLGALSRLAPWANQ
jgi:hypothetical protein